MLKVSNLAGFGAGVAGTPSGGVTDPDFDSVVLLASFDGDDAATSFSDESPSAHGAFTFRGTAQLDTARKKFGPASLQTDGTTSDSLTLADDADWAFGSGDFTVESWVNWDVLPASARGVIAAHWQNASRGWEISITSGGSISFTYYISAGGAGTAVDSGADDGATADTWHHVAASRSGNTLRVFLDGVEKASADVTGVTIFDSSAVLNVSALDSVGNNPMGEGSNAWIDELRITKGVGRYTAGFTPPTAKFPRAG